MKKLDFSKKIVIVNFVLIILFTIVCIVYQFVTREEMSATLIGAFFGTFSIEFAALATIKRKHIANKSINEEGEKG